MPASWGVAMQRYVACRAPEEVSSHMLNADNDDNEMHLTSQQMPNPLQDDTCGRSAASSVECWRKLWKVEEESEGLPKQNIPYFTKHKATVNNYIGSKPNGRSDLGWITRD